MILFFKMPKTASGYIKTLMKRQGNIIDRKVRVVPHVHVQPARVARMAKDKRMFCFARHPLTRLYSAWRWIRDVDNGRNHPKQNKIVTACKDFEDLCGRLDQLRSVFSPHFFPMSDWVTPDLLDWWGRYENLEEDAQVMNKRYGLKLPVRNDRTEDKGKLGRYSKKRVVTLDDILPYYTPKALALAQEFYARDFELFEYEMVTCPSKTEEARTATR